MCVALLVPQGVARDHLTEHLRIFEEIPRLLIVRTHQTLLRLEYGSHRPSNPSLSGRAVIPDQHPDTDPFVGLPLQQLAESLARLLLEGFAEHLQRGPYTPAPNVNELLALGDSVVQLIPQVVLLVGPPCRGDGGHGVDRIQMTVSVHCEGALVLLAVDTIGHLCGLPKGRPLGGDADLALLGAIEAVPVLLPAAAGEVLRV
mmetsp:Transcript_58959/g.105159  ORF Transcript_58959/g.105159 Transcript_58959/m.105159 type:complete len:202 (+) Transcript_58959:460-1065(+)